MTEHPDVVDVRYGTASGTQPSPALPPYAAPPYGTPPGTGAPAESPRRRRGPALFIAAVLAAGLIGAGATAGAERLIPRVASTKTVSAGIQQSGIQQSNAGLNDKTVSGTPESAAAVIGPSVVTIEVSGSQVSTNDGFGGAPGQPQAVSDTGSGVVVRADGYILTNNHVVAAAENGGTVNVTFSNGKTVPARIVGHDSTADLAVVKVDGVSDLKAAVFADAEKLKVGQSVLAVGAPLGLSNTVTEGIVSTLHRPVATGEAGAGSQAVIDAVQTDAAINPGNSGGALVDLAGRVVGINSAIASTGSSQGGQSGNIGVGFAIPSNSATKIAGQLISTGHATHSQMGASVGDAASTTAGAPGLGALIRQVTAGGPAERAGLRAGDVVVKVDDRRVTDANSLIVAIRSHDAGSVVTVAFTRNGADRTAKVTLAGVTAE
jgi:putative serine protease PepD